MALQFSSFRAYRDHGFDTVIDVRAPMEFAEDHMPGAISLPVLNDAERARVGTVYKQVSAFDARKIGAALVARNAAAHIEGPLAEKDGGWRPLVYCWRGGQRSNAFASILSQIGWRVGVAEGGYRAYRATVKALLYDTPFTGRVILLDGNTGTAKTELLHLVRARGVQIVDLEGLANHRGSLFGAMGDQPSQKGFESQLAAALSDLDPARPVLIEAESSKVGQRIVPPQLWRAMARAPRIEVQVPARTRAAYLTRKYGDIAQDRDRLMATLDAMTRMQGHARIDAWKALAEAGDMQTLALELTTHHYDPRYRRERPADPPLAVIAADGLDTADLDRAADRICMAMQAA